MHTEDKCNVCHVLKQLFCLSVATHNFDVDLSSPPLFNCMPLYCPLLAFINLHLVTLFHHTQTLRTTSKPTIRLNSIAHISQPLQHFYSGVVILEKIWLATGAGWFEKSIQQYEDA